MRTDKDGNFVSNPSERALLGIRTRAGRLGVSGSSTELLIQHLRQRELHRLNSATAFVAFIAKHKPELTAEIDRLFTEFNAANAEEVNGLRNMKV